jgi:hypothetical protein
MMGSPEVCKDNARRKEVVSLIINKMNEDGIWDSMKAKDVPEEIVEHVVAEIDLGKSPSQIRKEMGIRSQTGKEWQKISAAIKQGYRVNSTTYFHRLFGRNEKISEKLEKILNKVLDDDVEILKNLKTEDGTTFLKIFTKEVTPMIDALNRLQQGTVKLGVDLGVFNPPGGGEGKSSGVTFIIKSNILLPSAKEIVKQKIETVEAEVVSQKELPKP